MKLSSHPKLTAKFGANDPAAGSMAGALEAAADASPKSLKQVADDLGVRYGYLHEALNPNREDTQFQARLLVPFMKATGSFEPLRFQAHAMDCLLVPLGSSGSVDEHTATSLKEFGDYLHSVAAATADGRVTKAEALQVRREAEEAIAAVLAHVASIEARAEESR